MPQPKQCIMSLRTLSSSRASIQSSCPRQLSTTNIRGRPVTYISFICPALTLNTIGQPSYCRYSSRFASPKPSVAELPPHNQPLPAAFSEGKLLKYHVSRTKSHELPVYHDLKSGGTRKLTYVRKIAGDIRMLKGELQQHLGITDDRISINNLTNHIVIKVGKGTEYSVGSRRLTVWLQGWHKPVVVKFLEAKKL